MRNVYLGKRKSLVLAIMLTSATSLPAVAQNAETEPEIEEVIVRGLGGAGTSVAISFESLTVGCPGAETTLFAGTGSGGAARRTRAAAPVWAIACFHGHGMCASSG